MANLIKGALIKQLSKYLKNVSANQINISTFKGEGEMKNIQLDENVLMDLLELPTWLSITNAKCNKASLKIQWTKLKTIPIIIALDKIEVDMEINENLREYTTAKDSKLFDKDLTGPYGFIDRCIDGIQLNIDSITITIKSNKFNANLSMSNLLVYSTTPNWKITSDIRNTRLKDLVKEEIIVFKEISWEICRLEAFNIEETNFAQSQQQQQQQPPTSIKLIMNPSKVQIALKKKLSDKTLLNSTFRILLNEIYWMANDTQLKAAIGTYNTISKLLKKAALQKRKHMAYQQQQQHQRTKLPDTSKLSNSPQNSQQPSSFESSKVFLQYDIKETSLHLKISVLNIHLYADDNYSGNKLIDGGAMQVLFKDLCIDHYPYHKTGQNIQHWNNYNDIFRQRENWSKLLMEEFVAKLQTILNKININDINQIKLKNEVSLLESCVIITLKDLCVYKVTTNMSNKSSTMFKSKKFATQSSTKHEDDPLTTPNDLLKAKDYFIHQQMFNKRPFFSTNFAEFSLPSDTLFAQFFFSEFYFPDDCNYPVPCSQIFSHISPILINIDYLTLLWMNTLVLSLWNEKLSVDKKKKIENITSKEKKMDSTDESNQNKQTRLNLHCDTHIELLMPKLSISVYAGSSNRQSGIEVGFSRITATNKTGILNDTALKSACNKVYTSSTLLCEKNSKFSVYNQQTEENLQNITKLNHLAPCFKDLIRNENIAYFRYDLSFDDDLTKMINTTTEAHNSKIGLFLKSLNRTALNKNASKDLWCMNFESMWLDTFSMTGSSDSSCSNLMLSQMKHPNDINLNENFPLIQNISFKLWFINVHDFYKPFEDESSNDLLSSNSDFSSNNENLSQAMNSLSKIIQIEDIKIEPKKKRSSSVSVASSLIKSQQKSYYLCQRTYSKVNVIGEINELSLTCNHEQIIFLFRLIDTVDMFTKQLQIDSQHTLQFNKQSDANHTKDKNNNKKNINDINSTEQDENIDPDSSILNFSLIINSVEAGLHLNDTRKEFNCGFRKKTSNISKTTSQSPLLQSNSFLLADPLKCLNLDTEPEHFDSSTLNVTIKDPMRDELKEIARKIDQELITGYLKYIYGFSNENPNLRLSFSLPTDEPPNTNTNRHNDLLNLAKQQLQVNKLPSNLNNVVSVGISAANSTFMSKKNSTISFFNKPSFTQIKSNIKQQFNSSSNQSLNSIIDFNENDILVDDNDSYSVIMGMEQDDTSSLCSFGTDISVSYHAANSNSPKEKRSPNEAINQQASMSLSSSSSSITGLNKIASISSQVMTHDIDTIDLINSNKPEISTLTDQLPLKSFNDTICQTIQATILVKFKLTNLQTYVQINENGDIFSMVKVDQAQLRNMKSKHKKSQNSEVNNCSLIDDCVFLSQELSEILIRFKKIENSLSLKDGLVEVLVEDFFFEIDIPTLTGLIELIDDNDVGIEMKQEVMPFSMIIKNSQFNLNDQINESDELFKNEKTLSLSISHLLVNRLANNEIVVSGSDFNDQKNYGVFKSRDKKGKSLDQNEPLSCLDRVENQDSSSNKAMQLASLVFLLRKSKEENVRLQTRLTSEIAKNAEFETDYQMVKTKNENLNKKVNELKNILDANEKNENSCNKDQLELERRQFESLLQTFQEENEQLRNKLKRSDDLVAILNIERDCLMKKLNEQLKLSKK